MRLTATLCLVAVALIVAVSLWRYYTEAPWTRDGTVRVQVANIAPQISGQITDCTSATTSPCARATYST